MGDELDLGQRLVALLGEPVDDADVPVAGDSDGGMWARACVDVPAGWWLRSFRLARDDLALDFFDWLSAVDEGTGEFRLVGHLWSVRRCEGLLIRTLVSGEKPTADSVVDVYPGAQWHERETFEMFGIVFAGHPNLRKLLLADEFDAHPLRKSFVLAARAVKAWPGAVEPGERSDAAVGEGPGSQGPASEAPASEREGRARRPAPTRRKLLPPGVPEPGTWGPQ